MAPDLEDIGGFAPMSPNAKAWHIGHSAFILFIILIMASAAAAQKGATRRGSKGTPQSDLSNIIRPQLLNGDTDPTLRFPITSMPGSVFSITYGWLDITRSSIRYEVVQPQSKAKNEFEASRFDINELKFSHNLLMFKSGKKREMIIYLPQNRWGSIHTAPGSQMAAGREKLGTQSIYKTLLNFDGVLALVKPPAPPPPPVVVQTVASPPPQPKPAAPTAPPAIVLSAPSGAAANQVVETDDTPLVVRGVAMDSTGIPVVTINGAAVNMRPQTPQAAEFWSDPLPLQPGGNRIQITASNSAHAQASLVFSVHYTPKAAPVNSRALDKQEIISLLQGGVPSARMVELIHERGIKFSPTADDLNEIRTEGGTDELIQAIQQAAAHP